MRRCAQQLVGLTLSLALLSACTGPRQLETHLGHRRADSLQAQAEKVDGRWQVSLLLPGGQWTVATEEDQPFEIVPGSPRSTLRWTVDPTRWDRQDKPFRFRLKGVESGEYQMSVTYPPVLNIPSRFLLEVIGSVLSSIH